MGTGVFSGCHSLANVVFDDSHTIIPNNTFANVIPADGAVFHLPLNLSEIGFYAFEGSVIQKMNISDCTGLTKIGDYAFQGTVLFDSDEAGNPDAWKCDFSKCTKLTTIGQHAFANAIFEYGEFTLPDSVSEMGISVFFATVDANGKITAIKGGSAKITISTTTNSTSRTFTVNVINKGEVVEPSFIEIVGPKTANNQGEVYVGDTAVYSAKCLPSYANSGVLWTLSATTNLGLKVSDDMAYITGIKEGGTATLTARAANGNSSASLKIVDIEKTSALEFRETAPVIEKGEGEIRNPR